MNMKFVYSINTRDADREEAIDAIFNKDYETFMELLPKGRVDNFYEVVFYYEDTPYENRIYKDIRDRKVFELMADGEITIRKPCIMFCSGWCSDSFVRGI